MPNSIPNLLHCTQADDAVDEVQQWYAAAKAAAGMWAVVGGLLLLLAVYAAVAPYALWILPGWWRTLPPLLYAAVIPVLSRYGLDPACHWLNGLETHSTKVRRMRVMCCAQ